MTTPAQVLIVTPTRGTSRHLRATVQSVAEAGISVRHVLVCPAAAAPQLRAEYPNAVVVEETRPGLYAALNDGLRSGAEEVVTWLNDDDRFTPALADAVERIAVDATLDVIYGRVALIDGETRRLGELPVAHRPADLSALMARGVVPLAQPGTLLRRALVERLGGLDEAYRLAGDLDLFVRALLAGARFGFIDLVVAEFRLTGGQLSKDEATGDVEKARAIAPLGRGRGGAAALLRFRWANRRVYFDRVRRHGFVSMRRLYRRS